MEMLKLLLYLCILSAADSYQFRKINQLGNLIGSRSPVPLIKPKPDPAPLPDERETKEVLENYAKQFNRKSKQYVINEAPEVKDVVQPKAVKVIEVIKAPEVQIAKSKVVEKLSNSKVPVVKDESLFTHIFSDLRHFFQFDNIKDYHYHGDSEFFIFSTVAVLLYFALTSFTGVLDLEMVLANSTETGAILPVEIPVLKEIVNLFQSQNDTQPELVDSDTDRSKAEPAGEDDRPQGGFSVFGSSSATPKKTIVNKRDYQRGLVSSILTPKKTDLDNDSSKGNRDTEVNY